LVSMQPKATLGCPMTVAFNRWLNEVAQPAAQAWFGEQIVEVRQLSSYSCRRIAGSGSMSEHGYGNALDVAGFTFASGRVITVKHGWQGSPDERGFLRQVHAGGCEIFTTVLGPGYNAAHADHFHFDLARRSAVVCRPQPQLISPPRRYPNDPGPVPMVQNKQKHYERFPIARVPQPEPQNDYQSASVPPRYTPQRAPNQPLPPEQAYPPAQQQYPQQQNQQPMAISPQQNYPQQPPQYMRQAPADYPPQQPQQPQNYPQQLRAIQPPQHNPQMQWQRGPEPAPYNPNRPVPPARIGAKKNADEVVTGSIKNRKYYKDLPPPDKNAPKILPGED
ncbi:MAG: extensin family protein, partial [Xanthobacteraceae bacterium]